MSHRRRLSSVWRVFRIGRVVQALVAASLLGPLACDHSRIGGGGSGSAGHPEPGTGGTIGGTAGTGGAGPGQGGTGGTLGTGGDAAGIAGDSGGPGAGGTSGGSGAGTAGTSGTAGSGGGPGTGGTSSTAGSGGGPGTGGTTGTGGDGGVTGAGGSGSGNNLIANGDFSAGSTNWHTENPMNAGNVNNGAYCVSSPGTTTLVGWSAPAGSTLSLSGGYKLSFQASGSGTVHVKVGMAVDPFGPDFEANDGVSSSLQTFMHTFTANDGNAGLAFSFMNAGTSTVCIDNVTLTTN